MSFIRNPQAYAAACARNATIAPKSRTRARARAPVRRAYKSGVQSGPMTMQPYGSQRESYSNYYPQASVGQQLGGLAGGLLGQILGFKKPRAAYKSRAAPKSRVTRTYRSKQFKTAGTGDGVRLIHREYIQDVFSSEIFKSTSFSINPGLTSTFPWLSAVAQNFEQYKINQMSFQYKTTSSDALNSTDTALGTVIMSTDYNALSPPFINKQQMENNVFTVSTKPSLSQTHPIDTKQKQTPVECFNVRMGDVSEGDLRLYDLGNFQFATVGMQEADVNIGELWVEYDITFLKPKLSSGLNLGGKTAQFLLGSGVGPRGTNTITDASTLGNTPPVVLFNEAGVTLSSSAGDVNLDTITFPQGTNGLFRFTYRVHTTPASNSFTGVLNVPSLHYSNCEPVVIWQNYTSNQISNMGMDLSLAPYTGEIDWIFSQVIEITDPALIASIVFPVGTGGMVVGNSLNSTTLGDLIIGQLNGDLPTQPSFMTSKHTSIKMDDIESMFNTMLLRRRKARQTATIVEESESDDELDIVSSSAKSSPPQSFRKKPSPPPEEVKSSSSKKH